jgi:putative toxin-antitoxin system antitoxin component (TIGR02293 family)
MLTADDKEEIKRYVGEVIAGLQPSSPTDQDVDALQTIVAQLRDLVFNEGFTELTFINPETGERRVLNVSAGADSLAEITARAIEVFGSREKAMRWLRTPVRALGNQTPISLLHTREGLVRVQDTLGQVEHGVW